MEAVVLAGGLGTRLASRLSGIPKAMAPVGGRPFLEILLRQLNGAGFARVLLSVGHLREVIESHFGSAFDGMRVDYVVEDVPLGTGGAIRKALSAAREAQVLVLNGDTFLDADYAAMMRFHDGITMAVTRRDDVARFGGVQVREGRVIGFEEKGQSGPGWINAGAYVLPRLMEWPVDLGETFSFERDFLAREIGSLDVAAFEVDGFFLDIGVPEDLDRAQQELAGR
jgi:D-glycero-alpha-D-manno-heptose 1-phosphate guanylyltransferase